MKAIVKEEFKGVPDGETQPVIFKKGDTVVGDLAAVAVAEEWAVEDEKKPAAKKPAKS